MNNSEHNDLDKLLKDSLSDKRANVPASVWDNIEAELFSKKKRRGFFWLFFSGGLVIGGLAAGLLLFNSSRASMDHSPKTPISGHRAAPKATGIPGQAPSSPVEAKQEPVALSASSEAAVNLPIPDQPSKAVTVGISSRNSDRSGQSFAGKSPDEQQRTKIPETQRDLSGTTGDPAAGNANADSAADPTALATAEPATNDQAFEKPGNVDSLTTMRIMPVGNALADFLVPRAAPARTTGCGVVVYGGPSFFDMAVFKDYFVAGDLSGRSFNASGVEAGIGAYFRSNRLSWYTHLSFNRKQASFQYDVAITEADYFEYLYPGGASAGAEIPFENISNTDDNKCFLATDFTAAYTITSWQVALGGTMELLRWRKFSFGADLRFGLNMSSKLALKEWTIFTEPLYEKERYSAFRPAGGVWIWCQLSRRFAIGLTPMYSWQFQGKSSFTAGTTKELIVPVGLRIGL